MKVPKDRRGTDSKLPLQFDEGGDPIPKRVIHVLDSRARRQ
jgi:hypothetical protein